MRKSYLRMSFVFLVALMFFSSCIRVDIPDSFPYELMLRESDLPSDFEFKSSVFPEIDGGIAYYLSYQTGKDEIAQFVAHQINVFTTNELAQQYFTHWTTDKFIIGSYEVELANFFPKSPDDHYQIRCIDELINSMPNMLCEFIQLHENATIYVLGHINDKTLTFIQFEGILSVLDDRLPEGKIELPKGR